MKKFLLFIFAALLLSGVGYAQNAIKKADATQAKIRSSELLRSDDNRRSQEYFEKHIKANKATEAKVETKTEVETVSKQVKVPVSSSEVPSTNSRDAWDILFTFDFNTPAPGTFAPLFYNGQIYASRWSPSATGNALGRIYRYNIAGNTLVPDGNITVPGITGQYNLEGFTTDGTYIYAVNETNRIYKIDPATWTVAATITTTFVEPICIAYNEVTGGFWLGAIGGTAATLVSATGTPTGTVLSGGSTNGLMGLAYDNVTPGGPWLIGAFGSSNTYNAAQLGRWNIATGAYENIQNIATLPGTPSTGNSAGGIFTYADNGKFNLVGISQGATLIYGYELADMADPGAPAAATNFTVTPDASGNLTAVLNWTNPSVTVNGSALTALTAIKIYQDNDLIHTISNPTIGAAADYTVTVTAAGSYTYKVVGENAAGEGLPASATVWVGEDLPGAPVSVTLTPNDMEANLSWTAPTTGLNGGYFSTTGLLYDVYRLPGNVLVAEDQTGLTFTEDITQPGNYSYRVTAKNTVGTGGSATSNQVSFCPIVSTFPWTEGFEDNATNFPSCWEQEFIEGTTDWTVVAGTTGTPATAHSGGYKARFYSSTRGVSTRLTTPPFNLAGMTNPILTFWHTQQVWSGDQDILTVYYKANATDEWTLLQEYTSSITTWTERTISLPNPSSTYYIAFEGISNYGYGIQLDDVTVLNFSNFVDAEVASITAPVSGMSPDAAAPVTVVVKNNGSDPLTNFDLVLELDGVEIATETFTGTIPSVGQAEYTFDATLNLSTPGNYTVTVTAIVEDDQVPENNSITRTITVCGVVTDFPWTEGFEETDFPPACWTIHRIDGEAKTWTRNTSATYIKTGTGSAGHAYSTTSEGLHNTALVSPPLEIPAGNPIVEFWSYIQFPGDYDYSGVWISTTVNDDPEAFTEVKVLAGSEIAASFQKIAIPLADYIGETIYIAFVYGGTNAHSWYIDDVAVFDFSGYVDAEIASIVAPASGINMSNAEPVRVMVKNNGSDPLTDFDLVVELDGTVIATEPYTGAPIASLTQAEYTFTATLDLSAEGSYTIKVTAIVEDDQVPANDSKTVTITNILCDAITTFPWIEDFENGIPECWMNLDEDGDGEIWEHTTWGDYGGVAASFSYYDILGIFGWPLYPDNWLITPQIVLQNQNYMLSFKVGAADPSYYAENYSVLISTTGTALSNFTEIHSERLTSGGSLVTVALPLTAYAGQSIYIAFRHWDCEDQYALVIDDVTVSEFHGVDAELAQIITPASGINMSATEPVKVLVKNNGSNPLTGFSLKLELNGTVIATETYSGTPIPSLGQAQYTFNATLNLAAAGTYTVKVTAIAAGDGNPANDSKTVTVINRICAPVSLPFFENFDASLSLPACWSTIDGNGNGHNWYIMESENDPQYPMYDAYSGSHFAGSRSWLNNVPIQADNYLITPQLIIPAAGATLEYMVGQTYNADGNNERYSLLISTTGTNAANFTSIFSETLTSTNWVKRERSLDAYAGQNIYIAFRHHNSFDIEILKIDDVKVTPKQGVSTITQNNDVKIYPNPSTGLVNIEVSDNATVSIYDVTGRFISAHNIGARGTLTITQSVGLYFVKVESNGTTSTHKLVITK